MFKYCIPHFRYLKILRKFLNHTIFANVFSPPSLSLFNTQFFLRRNSEYFESPANVDTPSEAYKFSNTEQDAISRCCVLRETKQFA
jgi:hypothetical protein